MESLQPLTRKDVFILGAGFSKAVNELFPLAAELLGPIEDALGQDLTSGVRRKGGEGFEQWLSRLAEAQPYLSPDRNLERSAAFLRVSQKIAEILTGRENEALECQIPDWLAKLVFAWHIRHATIISFNYDNVVERAVSSLALPTFGPGCNGQVASTHDILNRLPPLPPQQMHEETLVATIHCGVQPSYLGDYTEQLAPAEDTFRLLKLHGSISWYWVSDDTTGVTLQRWHDMSKFGAPMGDQTAEIARQLPGRVPFIAPPSSTKSKYLGNPVIRKLWQDAYGALQKAEHVYFLGYSVPQQDLAAMGLIIEGIGDRTPSPAITVVDKRSTRVIDNLASLLLPNDKADGEATAKKQAKIPNQLITTYSVKQHRRDNALQEFSRGYFRELEAHAARSLNDFAQVLERETGHKEAEELLIRGELDVVPRPGYSASLRLCSDHMTVENLGGSTLVIRFDSCHQLPDGKGISKLIGELLSHECTQLVVRYSDPVSNKVNDFPVVDHRLELLPANMYGERYHKLSLVIFNTQQAPPNYRPEVAADRKAP